MVTGGALSSVHIPSLTFIKPAIEFETNEYFLLLEMFSCLGYCETVAFQGFLSVFITSVHLLAPCGKNQPYTERSSLFSMLLEVVSRLLECPAS